MKVKSKHLAGAAVAVLVGVALSQCDETVSAKEENLASEIDKTLKRTNRTIRNVGTEDSESDYTADAPSDENGKIPWDYDIVKGVRDCIESTGEFACFDSAWGGASSCYHNDEDESGAPIHMSVNQGREFKEGMFHQFEYLQIRTPGAEYLNYEELTQEGLNGACNEAINLLRENIPGEEVCENGDRDCESYWREMYRITPELISNSDELFDAAEYIGLDIKDNGGNSFTVNLDGWSSNIFQSFDVDRGIGLAEEPTIEATVQVQTPNGFYMSFSSPDEALEYLINKEDEFEETMTFAIGMRNLESEE